jgi:hypothetical protein
MKKLYLFSFIKEVSVGNHGKRKEKFLVVFYPYKDMSAQPNDIYNQLRTYFQFNILPDKIIILCASFNENEIENLFKSKAEVYNYIPLFTLDSKFENISLNSLQEDGIFKTKVGFPITQDLIAEVFNRGLVKIFNEKGGLIVSQSAHHFVFPSGKHSDRFLRPGNVLTKGIHINFIAFALYKHLKGKQFLSVYCDTSSINSLAFAYVNLLREFQPSFTSSFQIESFGSYQGFETEKFTAPKDSLFLISSSTSGSIIKRMKEDRKQVIQSGNICIIYGLDVEESFGENVICNLTFDDNVNPDGLAPFKSFNVNRGEKCGFCLDKSMAVEVKGDVFLLEKPTLIGKLLTIYDNPGSLKLFCSYFKKSPQKGAIIKCFYKENSSDDKKYEVYIDTELIFSQWEFRSESHPFYDIFQKLEKYIIQNIPASIKYLVVLPDNSSLSLAKIIVSMLQSHGVMFDEKNILQMDELDKIDVNNNGSIGIISSSVTTGRNLLFISRALREFEKTYQRIYFTFINRTANKKHFEFLESNLSLGEFGKNTHKIVNVENIFCPQEAYLTPWHVEKEFLKELEEFCEVNEISPETIKFCSQRIDELNISGTTNGLTDNLFFPSLNHTPLKVNMGFAFAPSHDPYFIEDSTQADIYFIIAIILNDCRSLGKLDQSEYVRNLLEPGNFIRFNDGIIQAAILRAAKYEELRFDLSIEMSLQIQRIFGDMVNHITDEHAEGILEFLYAMAIKKLRISKESMQFCIDLISSKSSLMRDSILKGIIEYIKQTILANE